jgi:outer membrane protein
MALLDRRGRIRYVALMNAHMKLVLASGALAGLSILVGHTAAQAQGASIRVAVVDVQRAVSQSEEGLRAQGTLRGMFDSRQGELNRRQTDMQKQREDIERQAKVISREALQKRLEDWQKQMAELQSTFLEMNKELERKQKNLTDPIVERVQSAIKRMANTEGFDIVVDKVTVAHVRADLDLTDRVIQMANGGAAPAPAPKPSGSAP